jgi:putative transcription antitermination factor YqgF
MEILPITLGIDYGTQRVGTALSHGSLAEPLLIIPNTEKLFSEIQKLLTEHQAEQIVVGLSENEMAEKTQQFVTELKKFTSLPIEFMDETLSSAVVHQRLAEMSGKKQTPKGPIDHFAAAVMLQEWLDLR